MVRVNHTPHPNNGCRNEPETENPYHPARNPKHHQEQNTLANLTIVELPKSREEKREERSHGWILEEDRWLYGHGLHSVSSLPDQTVDDRQFTGGDEGAIVSQLS